MVTINGQNFFKKAKPRETILLKQSSCSSNGIGKKQTANGQQLPGCWVPLEWQLKLRDNKRIVDNSCLAQKARILEERRGGATSKKQSNYVMQLLDCASDIQNFTGYGITDALNTLILLHDTPILASPEKFARAAKLLKRLEIAHKK